MPTYLLTVETCRANPGGLRVSPGLRATDVGERPAVAAMKGGSRIALLRPNGSTQLTSLVTYGLPPLRDPDDLYIQSGRPEAELCLVLPRELSPADVPAGTELWLIDGARH